MPSMIPLSRATLCRGCRPRPRSSANVYNARTPQRRAERRHTWRVLRNRLIQNAGQTDQKMPPPVGHRTRPGASSSVKRKTTSCASCACTADALRQRTCCPFLGSRTVDRRKFEELVELSASFFLRKRFANTRDVCCPTDSSSSILRQLVCLYIQSDEF